MEKSQLIQGLKKKGFSKPVLNAFKKVPRENFIPKEIKSKAYEDTSFPIGHNQTISQPYTIALMLDMLSLKKREKVLEVGSGCGYVLALINEITKSRVYGIERIKELSKKSKQNLKNYPDIKIYNKNGSTGLKEKSPFEKILISAAVKQIPKTLLNQLTDQGILVAPIDSFYGQDLVAIQKQKDNYVEKKRIQGFIFVPFIED